MLDDDPKRAATAASYIEFARHCLAQAQGTRHAQTGQVLRCMAEEYIAKAKALETVGPPSSLL